MVCFLSFFFFHRRLSVERNEKREEKKKKTTLFFLRCGKLIAVETSFIMRREGGIKRVLPFSVATCAAVKKAARCMIGHRCASAME